MTKTKRHYTQIDIARGIGILLVVFGHSLKQTQVHAAWIKVLTYLIYSFHMPLFFVLSGFVAARILDIDAAAERRRFLGNRAVRLLVPYFAIGLLYIPVKLKLSAYAVKPFRLSDSLKLLIGQNPDVSLWFLYILFIVTMVTVLLVNRNNFRPVLYGSFFLSLAIYWANLDFKTGKYLFFFLAGIWVRLKFEDVLRDSGTGGKCAENVMAGQELLAAAALVIFVFLNVFLYRTTVTLSIMGTSVCGTYLVLWFSCSLAGGTRFRKPVTVLEYLGRHSMDIYILHEPIMTILKIVLFNVLGLNYIVCTALIFAGALLIPMPVSALLIRRVKPLKLLFLGERS